MVLCNKDSLEDLRGSLKSLFLKNISSSYRHVKVDLDMNFDLFFFK